jgi:hypothetical protein
MLTRICKKCKKKKFLLDFPGKGEDKSHQCQECFNKTSDDLKKSITRDRCGGKTRKLIYDGVIKREACKICGKVAEAHHKDYSNPFDIVWLCSKHHHRWHKHGKPVYPPFKVNI